MKILVVDDDLELLSLIGFALRQAGFVAFQAADGADALHVWQQEQPDLIILDVNLPKLGGFEVLKRIRAESATPVMLLTVRASEEDQVQGLDLGADDYLAKPFSPRTLLARVRALLRRGQQDVTLQREVLHVGAIKMDVGSRRVWQGLRELLLSPKEFDLLACLMRKRGIALSRDLLLERVWGSQVAGDPRTVDVHVRWLREKIEADPSQPMYIRTVRGIGYRLEDLPTQP